MLSNAINKQRSKRCCAQDSSWRCWVPHAVQTSAVFILELVEQPTLSVHVQQRNSSCGYLLHNNMTFSDLACSASKPTGDHTVLEAARAKLEKNIILD